MAAVILQPYSSFTLTLPEAALREVFPESLLVSSLEYSGPIILPNPVVTPELLQIIQQILTTHTVTYTPLPGTNLVKAADYLNMPLLLLLKEPQLPLFQIIYPEYDLLDPETWTDDVVFEFAVANNACSMLEVFLHFLPRGEWVGELLDALVSIARKGTPECLRVLLRRVNPSQAGTYDVCLNGALYAAITHYRPENVYVLLSDPRTTFTFTEGDAKYHILRVIPKDRYDIFALIIPDARLSAEEIILQLNYFLDYPPVMRLLLTRPDLDFESKVMSGLSHHLIPTVTCCPFSETLSNEWILKSFHALFTYPGFSRQRFLETIYEFPEQIYSPALLDLLDSSSVDVNALPDGFYISLVYLNSPDVFLSCVERFNPATLEKIYRMASTLPNITLAHSNAALIQYQLQLPSTEPYVYDPEMLEVLRNEQANIHVKT
jgi:hypothetical protein